MSQWDSWKKHLFEHVWTIFRTIFTLLTFMVFTGDSVRCRDQCSVGVTVDQRTAPANLPRPFGLHDFLNFQESDMDNPFIMDTRDTAILLFFVGWRESQDHTYLQLAVGAGHGVKYKCSTDLCSCGTITCFSNNQQSPRLEFTKESTVDLSNPNDPKSSKTNKYSGEDQLQTRCSV